MFSEVASMLSAARRSSIPTKFRFLNYKLRLRQLGAEPSFQRVTPLSKMQIDPRDPVDRSFYVGNFAHELRRYIKTSVRQGSVAIDGGAQKGYITLHLRDAVGPSGKVYSFEPDPRSNRLLTDNCAANGKANGAIFPYALGARDETAAFKLSSQLGYSGLTDYEALSRSHIKTVQVSVRSIDSLVESGEVPLNRLDFIKLDCQGAELAILEGARSTIEQFSPAIWLEVDRDCLKGAGATPADIAAFFDKAGYVMHLPRLPRLAEIPLRLRLPSVSVLPDRAGDFDLLAVRRSA
jgi:FkbM family methyltransferase